MSLDDRLRADLREIAHDVDPSVETALRSVFEARDRRARTRAVLPRVLAAAACLVLVGGLLTWWLAGRAGSDDDDLVIEPKAPSGTYEATLSGDLAGRWRLRFLDGRMSLVAPDIEVLGSRAISAPYVVEGQHPDHRAAGPALRGTGSYTWADEEPLRLKVEDDDCALRIQLLAETAVVARHGRPPRAGDVRNAAALDRAHAVGRARRRVPTSRRRRIPRGTVLRRQRGDLHDQDPGRRMDGVRRGEQRRGRRSPPGRASTTSRTRPRSSQMVDRLAVRSSTTTGSSATGSTSCWSTTHAPGPRSWGS